MAKGLFDKIMQDINRNMPDEYKKIKRNVENLLSSKPKIICMDDVKTERVQWLWKPYIPLGKVTILQGDPGLGKTFFATQLAAIVSTGGNFPFGNDDGKTEAGNVVFQTAEDGYGDTLKPRLEKAGADFKRIFYIDEEDDGLTLNDSRLRATLWAKRPKLVVIDPLQAFFGADKDMNKSNATRPIMRKLSDLAAEFGCAIVLIGHLNKSQGGKTVYRTLGSIDFVGAVRSVLTVCEVSGMEYRRAVVQTKLNLEAKGLAILFDLDPTKGFSWVGTSDLTADDVLKYPQTEERKPMVIDECVQFLHDLLADGPLYATEVFEATEANDFTKITVRRAKEKMGIESRKEKGKNGKSIWELPHREKDDKYDKDDTVDDLT